MKKINIVITAFAIIVYSAMTFTICSQNHIMSEMKKDQQAYVEYYDATEELLDELEDSCLLEPFLEGDKGAKYLEKNKTLCGEIPRYNAKLICDE